MFRNSVYKYAVVPRMGIRVRNGVHKENISARCLGSSLQLTKSKSNSNEDSNRSDIQRRPDGVMSTNHEVATDELLYSVAGFIVYLWTYQ